jgi:hypothetical protein
MGRVKKKAAVIRRSIALPRQVVDEVTAVAPAPLRHNFNRLVSTALREFAAVQRSRAFERTMSEMAADPQIRAECNAIERQFAKFELDGLDDDQTR